MNTTSLLLNGHTAIEIESMIPNTRSSITGLPTPQRPAFMSKTSYTSSPQRPSFMSRTSSTSSTRSRPPSRDSPGWYLNEDTTPTLEDFAQRTKTIAGRINHWQGVSGKNVVMGLMRPTPMMLFIFHPIALAMWLFVFAIWLTIGSVG